MQLSPYHFTQLLSDAKMKKPAQRFLPGAAARRFFFSQQSLFLISIKFLALIPR